MKFYLLVLLGASFISNTYVGLADAQTCPSYTAGSTDRNEGTSTTISAIYVNNRADQDAPCSGTVYAWNYCYYDENSETNLEAAFGVFSFSDNVYTLREDSYYLLHLDQRELSFTCATLTLDPSEYFEIQEGDRVGACLRHNGNIDYLDILSDGVFLLEQYVHFWSQSNGGCTISDMMTSPSIDLFNFRSNSLHLFVDINIDECAANEDDCSEHATCSDTIGGAGSFQCTCNSGYTGNGTTCFDIVDECRTGTHNCGEQAVCIDTKGSFSCSCNNGYSGDGIICNDNNECEVSSDVCDSNAVCENLPGSYRCTCRTGYTGDGMSCFGAAGEECSAGGISTDGIDLGTNNRRGDRRDMLNGYVHINTNQVATCNGTVYGWSYCFDAFNNNRETQDLTIAMYRPYPNGSYLLVEGSVYEYRHRLDTSLSCGNITLQSSEQFVVQEKDVVGICGKGDNVWYYDKPASSSLLLWDARGCSDLSSSSGTTSIVVGTFLLSALIIEELEEGNAQDSSTTEEGLGRTEEGVGSTEEGLGSGAVAAIVIVVLIVVGGAAAVGVVIGIFLFYKRKQDSLRVGRSYVSSVVTKENDAYNMSTVQTDTIMGFHNSVIEYDTVPTSTNEAYGMVATEQTTAPKPDVTTSTNEAYGIVQTTDPQSTITSSANEAYGMVTTEQTTAPQPNITTSTNEAYGIVQTTDPQSTITSSSNESYGMVTT